jgi:hypothetical protein
MASAAYGGVHALAWNEVFPSPMEKLLWKISALFIALSGCSCSIFLSLRKLYVDTSTLNMFRRLFHFLDSDLFDVLLGLICCLVLVFWVFARAFLIIEAFINIRELLINVYATPTWAQFLPHL